MIFVRKCSREFSHSMSVSVTREMVESLRVAMYCYGIRVTRGNVWKNTSAFTFYRDYASWQVYKQCDRKTSCFAEFDTPVYVC